MLDVNDDAKGVFRRLEILTGPGRRRRWSAEDKARIVAETLVPGARVCEVARRWQLSSQQVFGWRRGARRDVGTEPPGTTATPMAPGFVPIVAEANGVATVPHATTAPAIEVRLAGAVVRVAPGIDNVSQLTAVLRAIRTSASRA